MVPGTLTNHIPPCTGTCAVTGKSLEPGDPIVVALYRKDGLIERLDALRAHSDGLPQSAWAVWQASVPAEIKGNKPTAELALTEVVFSEDTAADIRWDACQRLARKRRIQLSRVPNQEGLFLARCPDSGREAILRCPNNDRR
jgi:hypothetical protein